LLRETAAKLGADAVTSIGKDVAEGHACFDDAGDLVERDLPLRPEDDILGHTALATTDFVLCPLLRQVEAQRDRYGDLVPRQRQGDERLAVGSLAELAAVLVRDADRVLALLHQRRVVDDQMRVVSADERVRLLQQHALVRHVSHFDVATK
jgi:hypothetical protein